jgi:DNA-binding MarR family transcriptional regulator
VKPIGYWLNRTDRALTVSMDRMLAGFGLTRVAWQVLNVIGDGTGTTDAHVLSSLAAKADAPTVSAAVDTAVADGWAARPAPGHLRLTPEGRAQLAEVAGRVEEFRNGSIAGISLDEYRTAVSVLERITRNVEGR